MSLWCCSASCDKSTEGVMSKGPKATSFESFNARLNDVPIPETLIQALKVLDVSSKMVQEHHIKENSHDLR